METPKSNEPVTDEMLDLGALTRSMWVYKEYLQRKNLPIDNEVSEGQIPKENRGAASDFLTDKMIKDKEFRTLLMSDPMCNRFTHEVFNKLLDEKQSG